MQQTEKYKLNLIEKTDTFSPEALNANTQKVENALTAHEAAVEEVTDALAQADADLDSRVTALEVHKIAVGTYGGNLQERTINVGFAPKAVIIVDSGGSYGMRMVVPGGNVPGTGVSGMQVACSLTNNGFHLTGGNGNPCNSGYTYYYLALA